MYPLSLSLTQMLTKEGRSALERKRGAAYLAMQRKTFAPSPWREAGSSIVCKPSGSSCTLSIEMTPPSVVAVWGRAATGA